MPHHVVYQVFCHVLCCFSFNKSLLLTDADRIICASSHVPFALKQSIDAINNATSHQDVSRSLLRLQLHLIAGLPYDVIECLRVVKWKEALSRYLFIVHVFAQKFLFGCLWSSWEVVEWFRC